MHTEKREDPLVELGYEVRDLNTIAIRHATVGFFIFAIGSAIIGFACYRFMNPTVFEAAQPSNRVVAAPPNPPLQSNTSSKTDIMDIRQHETAVLNEPMGWVDASKTHVHVPIERAMEIIGERGLPATGNSVSAISKGHTPDAAIGEKPAAPLPSPSAAGAGTAGGAAGTAGGPPPPKAPRKRVN